MKSLVFAVVVTALTLPGQQGSLEFEMVPFRKTVALRAKVGGQDGLFVFDTAGGLSQLSPKFAERIGCRPWGRSTGFQMMGQRLDMPQCNDVQVELSGRKWTLPQTGVFDVMSLFPKDSPEAVDGLLALDLFAPNAITIDFPRKRLIIESQESLRARTARATEFPARIAREAQGRALAVSIGVPTAQGKVWMEVDSGNGGTILVSKTYATLFGLDPAKSGPQDADFPLGGADMQVTGRAFTPDMIIDGNIGMPFLKEVVLTLDLPAGRLWLSRGEPATNNNGLRRGLPK